MQHEVADAETIALIETIYMLRLALLLNDVAPSIRTAGYLSGRLVVRFPWWHWFGLGWFHFRARRRILRVIPGVYTGNVWAL